MNVRQPSVIPRRPVIMSLALTNVLVIVGTQEMDILVQVYYVMS